MLFLDNDDNALTSRKTELRSRGLKRRDGIDDAARIQFASRLAVIGPRLILDFPCGSAKPVASLYVAIGSEPDLMPLATALDAANVDLALPVDWSPGSSLVYRQWRPGDRLSMGPLGIAEPLQEAPACVPDILFIPATVFDRRGHRIGYGAGNVDRTLRTLRARKRVLAIGIAYAVQEDLFVPDQAHDEALDIVVTDRDILFCHR